MLTARRHDGEHALQVGDPIPRALPERCQESLILLPIHPSGDEPLFWILRTEGRGNRLVAKQNRRHWGTLSLIMRRYMMNVQP
jgi:hypothetical protein